MKDLDLSMSIQSLISSVTKSISSIKYKKIQATAGKRSLFRAPSIRLAIAVLLATGTLTASMIEGERSTAAFAEAIATFAADCSTPQTAWGLNETACAVVTGAIDERRIVWVAPDGTIADVSAPFFGAGSDNYTFVPTGPLAQFGTWIVKTVDNSGAGYAVASFLVRDASVDNVDLVVSKFGPDKVIAGGAASYRIEILNRGPNVAESVVLTESTPNDATFASEVLVSGPDGVVCGNPDSGQTGTSTCTIPSLGVNESAIFTFVYNVNAGTPVRTIIINTATVSSSTNELFQNDNTGRFQVEVAPGAASPACTITCPADMIVDNNPGDPNPCVKNVTYTVPIAPSGCADPDSGQIPTVVCSPPSGSNFPIGSSSVVCSAGSSTCSFTITVNDTRAPVTPTIVCPSDVTANESSPGSGSARVNYPAPTTTGNCVSVVCNPQSGDVFVLGTTPVTCTGTDSANTIVTCTFSVTVNVSTCGIDCPADITVNESAPGSGSATVDYDSPATTGCTSVTIVCNPTSGSSFPVGITQVNCTATDESSSIVAACSFTVRVNSSSTCTITCPSNVTTSESPSGSGSATVNYPAPTSSGTCAAPASCNPPSGSTFPIGTTSVVCTQSDPAGNVSSCSFTVTVTGGNPCVITCPSNITQSGAGCGTAVTYPSPTTTGSCGDPSNPDPWSCNPPSGAFFPVGTTTVVCSTDVGSTCSFTITISGSDAIPPTIGSCATPRFLAADNCQAVVPNVTSDVDATDNCTPANSLIISQSPAAGTIVGTGTTTIVVTVKDANNNSSTCNTTLTVFENSNPTAVCKNITVFLNASGTASITGADVDNGSSDNCGIVSRTVSPNTFTCANRGPNTVTLTVRDASNNEASCQATVTVVDNTPPTALCTSITVALDATGNASITAAQINNGSSDNCGVASVSITPSTFTCANKGPNTVTLTVTDTSNNTATCQATVTVVDAILPTITCVADINVDFDPAVNGAVVTYATPVGADNCPGATTAQIAGLPSGGTFPAGTTTNTFRVTDGAGLTAECSFKVTVALTSLIGLDSVSITGAAFVDSYESTGGYPATKSSLTNVLSNGTITLGNSGKVFGNVRSTRANVALSGLTHITGNATAGTNVTTAGSSSVGGTITNNQLAPVMTVPSVSACGPPYSPNAGISGSYSYNPGTGDLTLNGTDIATLANGTYCFRNVTMTNSAQLLVNGPVVIKVTGTFSASGATQLSNTTGIPSNLRILSSYAGTNGVTLSNGTSAHLMLYAPNTRVTISGAAPLFGTVVGKSLIISNSGMVHYDILLKSVWPDFWSLIQ